MSDSPFSSEIEQNWRGFVSCIQRRGTPERVHFMEISLDAEVQQAICDRYGLLEKNVGPDDPFFEQKRHLAVQRFLGYDYVCCGLENVKIEMERVPTKDTAAIERKDGRAFADEHRGLVSSWEEFERFPWPDPEKAGTRSLEWYTENLPDDMCIMGAVGVAHLPELMGYETLCYALFEQRDLVAAVSERLLEISDLSARRITEFDRVKLILAMDDMGFKSSTLISPDDLREFVLPIHKAQARASHAAGRPYVLHSCGNINAIMEDLIEDIGIDAKHSFEDTIETVIEAKASYGDRIAVLGGIDMDFLCRANEQQIRERVRETLEKCMPGGGYCLGTGNTVANYIPLNNYLTMLDEGRKFKP